MADPDDSSGRIQEGAYPAEERFTLAEAPGLRVRQLSLAAGQCVPWHFHNEITDTLVCMKGPMSVKTRDPDAIFELGEQIYNACESCHARYWIGDLQRGRIGP